MWASKRRQQNGAALVEAAIVMLVFLMLTLGTMELILVYFAWNRTSEAAREGVRWAVVNTPVSAGGVLPDCPAAAVVVSCAGGTCGSLLTRMQTRYPLLQAGHVSVRYACSNTGNPALPASLKVYDVAVTVAGVPDPLLLFLNVATLPSITVARTSEDMSTP